MGAVAIQADGLNKVVRRRRSQNCGTEGCSPGNLLWRDGVFLFARVRVKQRSSSLHSPGRPAELLERRPDIPYQNVLTAQVNLLTCQQAYITFQTQQLVSSAQLIEALGGVWDTGQLPGPREVSVRTAAHFPRLSVGTE